MNYSSLPIIRQAFNHRHRVAILDATGAHTYDELLHAAHKVATRLLNNKLDLEQARVSFMVAPGFEYTAVQWGIWLAGGIAVPHCISHPVPELEYVLTDTQAEVAVAAPEFGPLLRPLASKHNLRFLLTPDVLSRAGSPTLPQVDVNRRAMILYTSGTTSKPKGVVTTHRNLAAQIVTLVEAWGWTADDHILNVLPLHHTHGIINVMSCALWSGAICEFLPKFDADAIWEKFSTGKLTVFMAVPTIYIKLTDAWEAAGAERQKALSAACARLRLMVSGSAALPVTVFEKWKTITGHTLLERYGMTEIGMALSNPLEEERRPGTVGQPLPGVEVRVVAENGRLISEEGTQGELLVKGPGVFLEYWHRPEATQDAFQEGWFKTGDIVTVEEGYYRILGRNSVDIIKTGGYKVSALEIEEVLRTHPKIKECAVVGVPDSQWGECVCAALTLNKGASLTTEALRAWAKQRLARYKVPNRVLLMEALPRNVMGKVMKPEIIKAFWLPNSV